MDSHIISKCLTNNFKQLYFFWRTYLSLVVWLKLQSWLTRFLSALNLNADVTEKNTSLLSRKGQYISFRKANVLGYRNLDIKTEIFLWIGFQIQVQPHSQYHQYGLHLNLGVFTKHWQKKHRNWTLFRFDKIYLLLLVRIRGDMCPSYSPIIIIIKDPYFSLPGNTNWQNTLICRKTSPLLSRTWL